MPVLTADQVDTRLRSLSGWTRDDDEIRKEFKFGDFKEAMVFVNHVADAANAADHHPDIDIRYNKVLMSLSTHSEGGVTENDIDMASKIDAAAG